MPTPAHLTQIAPGAGRRVAPRADLASDAPRLDLTGDWAFRLLGRPGDSLDASGRPVVGEPEGWDTIDVPSHWVLRGDGAWGRPHYTNVQYPFPLEPPFVPDNNPTADYRRTVEVPDAWCDSGRVLLRTDGIESIGQVWMNGTEVGVIRGSRLRQELDVTDAVTPGKNEVVIRVSQWSAMSYLEDQDQWWLPGIFRDVALLHRPDAALDDVWLRPDFDPATGRGTLSVELRADAAAYPVTMSVPDLNWTTTIAEPTASHVFELGRVEPWSADVPRLYPVTVRNQAETITQRVGFRRVEVVGDAWLVNGRRLRLRGVNRHDYDPVNGRVFDEAAVRDALCLMKRHNLNAIRTSHYPPHPRLLDLADELGFWVIDECDLETHGFWLDGWKNNPSDDPAWRDVYLDRIERTFERDKNHPCIVAWSLGNESGAGANLSAMAAWLHRRSPACVVHYEHDHLDRDVDVVSRMYAPPEELARLATQSRVGRPIIECEYAHAMGNGPGQLAVYEEVFDAHPSLHGGFLWEWRDHGLLTATPDGTPFYAYGGDFGEVVHDGSFCCDGLVLSDGTPSPALAEVAAVFTPIKIALDAEGFTVENRRHDGTTADLVFTWTTEDDGRPVASGELVVAPVAAGASATLGWPSDLGRLIGSASEGASLPDGVGERWLTVRAQRREASAWAEAGHVMTTAQRRIGCASAQALRCGAVPADAVAAPERTGSGFTLGDARFDADGTLTGIGDVPITGAGVSFWRAPTENDELSVDVPGEFAAPPTAGVPGRPMAELWREFGLDRLTSRLLSLDADGAALVVRRRYAAAQRSEFIVVTQAWSWLGGALRLEVSVEPSTGWTHPWPRVGVHLGLPSGYERADWFGTGPGENYPDSHRAARVGRFAASIDDLVADYAVPQESGHRADLRELTLTGTGLPSLMVRTVPSPGRPGFVVARHTAEEWTAAAHPHELPASTATHLYLDLGQNGLGTHSCGPDVRPDAALWPRVLTATATFSVA